VRKDNIKWTFVKKQNRPPLDDRQVSYFRELFKKTLKAGIEFEYNLNEQKKSCKGNNPSCRCTAVHSTKDGSICFNVCTKKGKCELEKEFGCAEMYCVEFDPPCATCKLFNKGCSVCPLKYDPIKDPENIRNYLSSSLEPSKFLGKLGKYGVLDIVKDGSLVGGGVEIVTVGQRVDFWKIYNMCSKIMSEAKKCNAFVDERCSIHVHLLTGYLNSEKYNNQDNHKHYGLAKSIDFNLKDVEEPVPEIILANFHQLWRRYENAIVWMTSSLNTMENLTRWIKFRRSMLKFSSIRSNMKDLVNEMISEQGGENSRYMMVNYTPTKFYEDGNIKQLHFELRVADGSFSPAQVTAITCLFYAMLIKSVDLSRYGIVESGGKEYMESAKNIGQYLINNNGTYSGPRVSNTSFISPYIPVLQKQSADLISLLKNILLGMQPVYDILSKLAENPVSLERVNGFTWEEINTKLMGGIDTTGSYDEAIMKAVDMGTFVKCESIQQWLQEMSEDSGMDLDDITCQVGRILEDGKAFWNEKLGTLISR